VESGAPAPAAAAPASAAATPGSFIATQSPAVTAARSSAASSILLNENALLKGLHRWACGRSSYAYCCLDC
jgi:hypothetical protein